MSSIVNTGNITINPIDYLSIASWTNNPRKFILIKDSTGEELFGFNPNTPQICSIGMHTYADKSRDNIHSNTQWVTGWDPNEGLRGLG